MASGGSLPPISYASIVIGFVSFTLTLLTLLRVTWDNIQTLTSAPNQVYFSLANLQQSLYEERDALRRAAKVRSHSRRYSGTSKYGDPLVDPYAHNHGRYEDGPTTGADMRVLQETVRKLCRDFKRLEKPFLRELAGVNGDKEFDGDVNERYRYRESGFEDDYEQMTLAHRFTWLRTKSAVDNLWVRLERVQLRRMAREVTVALA
jgi:hypothetical protein